ncbi:MAG: Fpg/Nei family DNA glycosylase, partial [Vicinamibacterales bacterium]
MPEGDTIYRAARTLHRALATETVTRFETGLAAL